MSDIYLEQRRAIVGIIMAFPMPRDIYVQTDRQHVSPIETIRVEGPDWTATREAASDLARHLVNQLNLIVDWHSPVKAYDGFVAYIHVHLKNPNAT